MCESAHLTAMPYKTDQNIIGRQVTTEVEEMISGIRICYGAGTGLRTGSILVMPTVTGTQTLDISGCAGVGALTNPQKAVATGKGWTLDVTP